MKKCEINPAFTELRPFAENIREVFPGFETTLQDARNVIRVAHCNGRKLCIKSFGNHNPINRLVYSFIRQSKAERSYRNALKLIAFGVKTPLPVGYLEYYNKKGVLENSYYISVFQDHDFRLTDVIHYEWPHKMQILASFARFACEKLHNNGIYHKDLSPGNVLINEGPEGVYEFSLVDLNRIRFKKKISYRKRMANFKRINISTICMGTLAHHYALHYPRNPFLSALRIGTDRLLYEYFRKTKRRLKKSFKALPI